MTERIEKAINIFLKAIEEGTLAKGTCKACAVGNLVADGLSATISKQEIIGDIYFECNKLNDVWAELFCTDNDSQKIFIENVNNLDVQSNIKATDFKWQELAAIEKAFENNTEINSHMYPNYTKEEIRKDQIKGLEAVVEVMLDFDDCKDKVKEVFTLKAELIEL